jgi:anti-sigma regulatory factor (Ser/Thr protein kinase)
MTDAMADTPNVRLRLSNRSENILLVREMLTGVAETVELDTSDLYDIRTAVTEACNNVSLHAYEGAEGPMDVELRSDTDVIEVVVRDRGVGIKPRIRAPDDPALGIGLPLIQALVHSVEFTDIDGRGTEVRMSFLVKCRRPLESAGTAEREPASEPPEGSLPAVGLAVAPPKLARAVLPRILSVLGARAHFSTDRISDAQIVADALAAHAPSSLGEQTLSVTIAVEPRSLQLRVGPLGSGRAQRLIVDSAVEGLGGVIERLTDDRRVAEVGSEEVLALQLNDRR